MALFVNSEIHCVFHLLEEAAVVVAMEFQILFVQRLANTCIFHEAH